MSYGRRDLVEVCNDDDPNGEPVIAQVVAAPNGDTLCLFMNGGIRCAGGVQCGPLALLRDQDGTWRNAFSGEAISVTAADE